MTQSIGNRFFHRVKSIEKNTVLKKKKKLTQSIEKSFLIDPLNTNNAIYHDPLTLMIIYDLKEYEKNLVYNKSKLEENVNFG